MPEEVPRPLMRRFAHKQRTNAVRAEQLIWRAVRNRRCQGMKFQRQVVMGNFIADFVCFERRLIVEVDGPSHEAVERKAADVMRDAWLEAQGFQTLCLSNALVTGSTELAVERIRWQR